MGALDMWTSPFPLLGWSGKVEGFFLIIWQCSWTVSGERVSQISLLLWWVWFCLLSGWAWAFQFVSDFSQREFVCELVCLLGDRGSRLPTPPSSWPEFQTLFLWILFNPTFFLFCFLDSDMHFYIFCNCSTGPWGSMYFISSFFSVLYIE